MQLMSVGPSHEPQRSRSNEGSGPVPMCGSMPLSTRAELDKRQRKTELYQIVTCRTRAGRPLQCFLTDLTARNNECGYPSLMNLLTFEVEQDLRRVPSRHFPGHWMTIDR